MENIPQGGNRPKEPSLGRWEAGGGLCKGKSQGVNTGKLYDLYHPASRLCSLPQGTAWPGQLLPEPTAYRLQTCAVCWPLLRLPLLPCRLPACPTPPPPGQKCL